MINGVGSLECSLFSTNIIYPFVLVSVLESMHACTVWHEPSLLGLSSVKCSGIFGKFIKKKNQRLFSIFFYNHYLPVFVSYFVAVDVSARMRARFAARNNICVIFGKFT